LKSGLAHESETVCCRRSIGIIRAPLLIVTGLAHGLGRSGRLQLLVACVKIEQQRTKSGNASEEIVMIFNAHKIDSSLVDAVG